MRPKFLIALPTAAFLVACANSGSSYVPIIDGPVGPNFNVDLAQCQQISTQQGVVDESTASTAATSAVAAGAAAAIIDNSGNNALDAAIAGAVIGGAASTINNRQQQEAIIRNCMRGRGYNVVG
ncbi:MAG: glycine zipper family protein [Rhodobacteraceae bacterium]|nr:glycine zipper family protein [Paracoccaceae bacterium]